MSKETKEPIGIAVVDKPAGLTSHDVVAKARKIFGTRKVGHSGTLDPDATGVLLLGVGRATRLLQFLTRLPKSYKGEIVFGEETSTLDSSGEIIRTYDMSELQFPEVREAATKFLGEIEQVPPMVSAVRVGGRRLHEIAREGGEVERPSRTVSVKRFEVNPTAYPLIYEVSVDCSSGTYIRSLAADLGASLGGGAHLQNLRRTAIGSFEESEAMSIEEVVLRDPIVGMRDFETVEVSEEVEKEVTFGKILEKDRLGVNNSGPWAVVNKEGRLLAVYDNYGEKTKPTVVLVG
ncbi:MAG: tRNA pseudouridine(55) synthase TruB [Acidimicrobiales bacterium]|nr:tRNA pseudouridine(55) synthase TruB [Acidimicrobiales bacterium]|tara:strand:- start:4867 stop:5739 length:873 start_codon:yes stop_codon:yes gene_type:complete